VETGIVLTWAAVGNRVCAARFDSNGLRRCAEMLPASAQAAAWTKIKTACANGSAA